MSINIFNPLRVLSVIALFSFTAFQSYADDVCLDMHVIHSVPLGFADENGNAMGLHVEVLQELERYSGICMTKTLMPVARIWKSIEQGDHDGGLMFRTSGRAHLVEYVSFIRDIETIVVPLDGIEIASYESLKKLTIGKIRSTPLSNDFDNDNELNLLEISDYGQLVDMLHKGRIDAVAGGAAPLFYNMSAYLDLESHANIGKPFILGRREQWLQLSKKSDNLDQITNLRKAAELMVANGDYERLMTKYYGTLGQKTLSRNMSEQNTNND